MNSQLYKTAKLLSGIIGKVVILEIRGLFENIECTTYLSGTIKGFEHLPSLECVEEFQCIYLHIWIYSDSDIDLPSDLTGNQRIYIEFMADFIKLKYGDDILLECSLFESPEKLNCCLLL
jgi:hypothetical protein